MTEIKRRGILKTMGCALAVVVATGLLLLAFSVLFYPKNNQQAFGMTNEVANGILGERENSIDVVFIGDSEAYSSFSPLQMWEENGFTSYVCATSQQQLPYGNTLLHRATQNQRPRVVVIETNSVYAPFSADEAILRTLQDAFPVLEFHDRWKTLTSGDFSADATSTYSHDMKGFYLCKDVSAADATGYMAPSDDAQEIPLINKLYLRQMVDYCRKIGAEPLLVSTPSTVCWNTARHNGMAAFAHELGVSYLDLNTGPTKVDINWSAETRDAGDHLNLSGAQKVSNYLGAYLSRSYDLPGHRNDEAFSAWNESLARYKGQVQGTE